jgi:hypothetical protein
MTVEPCEIRTMPRSAQAAAVELPNGVSLAMRFDEEVFLGFGAVTCGGIPLRSPRRPMFAAIRNPWGVRLLNFRLAAREALADGGVRLRFDMDRLADGPMEWMIHECRPVQNVDDWSLPPRRAEGTELALEIRPVSREIGGLPCQGFSYRYEYRSRDLPVYQILDRATWEVGGAAVGNELWFRNANVPPIHRIADVGEHLSSEWYLGSCLNPNIFQFLPLQTHLQGFTMTVAEAGALLTWCPRVSHVRTLLEKPRRTDEIVHLHEHCGDLSHEFATAPMEVLFVRRALDRVGRANLHGAMADLVADTLHAEAGLRREYALPYGQIEEWTDADLDLYRREGLPALAAAGMVEIELANHFQNNMNTWGLSNFCSTVDHQVSPQAGEERLRAFCRDAAGRGIRVLMWGNTAISSLAVLMSRRHGAPKGIAFLPHEGSVMDHLAAAEHPFVRTPGGAIDADHYTPEFCVMNLRDPVVRRHWLDAWRRLAEEVGIQGIFLDSSFNLSSDKFDWRFNAGSAHAGTVTVDQTGLLGGQRPAELPPASIQSQYHAHLSLVREMQAMGYRYCAEDSGVFGLHRNGPAIERRLDNLFLWSDFIAGFDPEAIRRAGADPEDIFFRGLACRLVWQVFWDVPSRSLCFRYGGATGPGDAPSDWHQALFRAYRTVQPHMRHRTILANEDGIRYDHEGHTVLWAFRDMAFDLPAAAEATNVLTGERCRAATLAARRHNLYLVAPTP